MRRRQPARVLGPYTENELWRIIEVDARGRRKSYTVDSKQAANRLAAKLRMNLGARTVGSTIDDWEAARLRSGGATPTTIADQSSSARALLGPVLKLRLGDITDCRAAALYERITTEPSKKTGRPLSAATHRLYLSIVQSMWKWAQKHGYVQRDPWAEVEPIGRVSSGKPQLRPAEARLFARLAEQEAEAGSATALAALCCLNLGLRASESLSLTARDVDAEAGEVYVNGTKTAASKRRLQVPAHLAVLLGRAAAARQPFERLCRVGRQSLHSTVVALCARAGVPRVCVHGLRGTHASLAVAGGAAVEAVARVLGHTSTKMTLGHYVTEEVATGARLAAVQSSLNPQKSFRDPFQATVTDDKTELPLLFTMSPSEVVTTRAAQTEPGALTQDRPSREAQGDLGQQPGTVTPWEALQIVKAELQANGPIFDKPLEEVLAALRIGQAGGDGLSDSETNARQARLLAFIDSCEARVEELLIEAVQAGEDPADCIALLSDGTVLPPYTTLVARSEVAAQVAILLGQVHEPLLSDEWHRPTPGILLVIVLFEGGQAVSEFGYSVERDLGSQA